MLKVDSGYADRLTKGKDSISACQNKEVKNNSGKGLDLGRFHGLFVTVKQFP